MTDEKTDGGKRFGRWIVLGLVVLAVLGALALRNGDNESQTTMTAEEVPVAKALPKLLDLGADKCIPCKAMMPVLAEIEEGLTGQLEVVFVDVWKDPAAAKPYGIKLIPTQIFLDPDGKELFRHEGFFARDDILAEWQKLGYKLELPAKEQG